MEFTIKAAEHTEIEVIEKTQMPIFKFLKSVFGTISL